MSLPLIGITTRTAPLPPSNLLSVMVQRTYTNAILEAGGVPVLIPSDIPQEGWEVLFEKLNGILFTGGGDIAVEYFHGVDHPEVYGIEPARDAIEVGMANLAYAQGTPFLGICRGLQVINVALGGTLYTHIPDQLAGALLHDYPGEDGVPARTALAHTVTLDPQAQIASIMDSDLINVNSLHHQGIKDVAPVLKAVGHSDDGLVEAIEAPGHPWGIAVQWHPEWLTDQAEVKRLFKSFVDAAIDRQRKNASRS